MRFFVLFAVLLGAVAAFKQSVPPAHSFAAKFLKSTTLKVTTDEEVLCGPCPQAPKCKGLYSTKGCDGTGKIQGGIATVPFLKWWPIKVFRPCPSYLQAGYQYKREGQTMDQVLFSEPSTKQRESMEKKRLEKEKVDMEIERQQQVFKTIDEKTKKSAEGVDMTEAEKFLNDTFGG